LAKKLAMEEILMDEVPARIATKLLGLTPRGTIFVLLRALEMKELTLDGFLELLSRLVQQGFRLRGEVFLEAVRKAQETAEKNG